MKKKMFKVSVEKRMYATGFVMQEATSVDKAIDTVQAKINTGELQTTDVEWSEPQYEDMTFGPTGDVD